MVAFIHLKERMGGLVQEDGNNDGQRGCEKNTQRCFLSLPKHGRAIIDEEITYSDLSERIHLLKSDPNQSGMRRKRSLAHQEQDS